MEYESPQMVWLMLFVPVLIVGYAWAQRRRRQRAARYSNLPFVQRSLAGDGGWASIIPAALVIVALIVMIVATMRPTAVFSLPVTAGTIVLAIDTSGSMIADDVKPTRMDAAKTAARLFVNSQPPGVRIGVVSFSDDAWLVQWPSADPQAVIAAINALSPQQGTAIGLGLQVAVRAALDDPGTAAPGLGPGLPGNSVMPGAVARAPAPVPPPDGTRAVEPATVILVTDGESNLGPEPVDIARQLADRPIRVFTIGIGSSQGAVVHVQGQDIPTRLDEDTLKSVAAVANGAYYHAITDADLQHIYATLGTRLVYQSEKNEITALLAGVAALICLAGTLAAFIRSSRAA